MLLVLPANQHVCQHRERRSKHFSPSHIKGGVTADRHYHPENVPSDFARVLLTAISSGLICIRGDSLTHALELKDATAIHVWMEESDGSGNDTHNSQQRRWQNRLWAFWRGNSGAVRAEGGLGEELWIKSMQSICRTKGRNTYFVASVMVFCFLRTLAEKNNGF